MLYVELGTEHQVDSLFSYTKMIRNKENRVTRWIPKQMYSRYRELEKVAYSIRREEHLKIGLTDFELSTIDTRSAVWKRCSLPANLPKINVHTQIS